MHKTLPIASIALTLVLSFASAGAEETRFGEYDRDEDGQLNRVEVANDRHLAVNFSRLDANGDGYLSREEAETPPGPVNAGKEPGSLF